MCKMLTMVYKCLNDQALLYPQELIKYHDQGEPQDQV